MKTLRRIMITVVVLAIWEGAYQLGALNPIIFGAPSLIIKAALTDG